MSSFPSGGSAGRSALAALDRQSSRNAVQPVATPRNAVQPAAAAGKTNPPPPLDGCPPPRAPSPRPQPDPVTRFVLESAALETCNALQPSATPRDAVQPSRPPAKTNPPTKVAESRRATALTPRQLAAARLIAVGRSLPDVAAELKLSRSTVWRWTRTADFKAELARLHELWSRMLPARHAR